ncbi:hypothetical protein [Streptomyces sp. NPDC001348]
MTTEPTDRPLAAVLGDTGLVGPAVLAAARGSMHRFAGHPLPVDRYTATRTLSDHGEAPVLS